MRGAALLCHVHDILPYHRPKNSSRGLKPLTLRAKVNLSSLEVLYPMYFVTAVEI
jgi:hypothetical protein